MTPARTLPARWYVDEAVYQRERETIFSNAWWLLCPLSELTNPGAYRASSVAGWPVFVLRGADGELRGFHNVCRHRAAPLLAAGAGHCSQLRCPYHGWLYSDTGELRNAPNFIREGVLDTAGLGLFALRVAVWRGLVFVCLSDQAPGLSAWLGSVDTLCESFPGPDELELYGEYQLEGRANWKTYCDNTVEGYHLHLVHPRLSCSLARDGVDIRAYDAGAVVAFHVTYAGGSDGSELRGERGLWVYRFPGFQLVAGPHLFKAERVEPDGPRALKSTNWAWFGRLSAAQRRDAFDWGRQIVREDLELCEGVQRNLEAGVYTSGPLSPARETHVAGFQRLVHEAVSDHE